MLLRSKAKRGVHQRLNLLAFTTFMQTQMMTAMERNKLWLIL